MLLLNTIAWSQDEKVLFDYLKHKVKVVNYDDMIAYSYSYSSGVITQESIGRNEYINYYYSELNRVDSSVIITKTADTIFQTKTYYKYDSLGHLVLTKMGDDPLKNIIYIDSFMYNSHGLVERKLVYSNRREELFGTERVDSIMLFSDFNFKYDSLGRLIEKSTNQLYTAQITNYVYNDENRLVKRMELHGFERQGCIVMKDRSMSTTTIHYNNIGLVEKEITQYYLLKPNGKKKKNGKSKTRLYYAYY